MFIHIGQASSHYTKGFNSAQTWELPCIIYGGRRSLIKPKEAISQ
jgi:hypothetical protein